MPTRRIHLEQLVGRQVRDLAGEPVGHIEEFRAENNNGHCEIQEYLLGRAGLLHRLSIPDVAMLFLRPFGARRTGHSLRVPWQQMDLSDPMHPRLRCTREQLRATQPKRETAMPE
jgi:hypothetical protein